MEPSAHEGPTGFEGPARGDSATWRPLHVRFTGSGSEYFRIWIVNLLLMIVTLSLYRPWAKVRRLKYFYANTLVEDHALDFHGNPRKMLRGYLLVGAMLIVYSAAGKFSPMAGLVAFIILCVLWPALWRASMQFRLANTSWRGLRFRFTGEPGDAYRSLLPLFLPGLVVVAMGLGVQDRAHPPTWYLPVFGVVMLVTLLVVPLALWNLKRYQHSNYSLGQWRTQLTTGPGSFYLLSLKVGGMFVASVLIVGILSAMFVAVASLAFHHLLGDFGDASNRGIAIFVGAFIGVAVWLLMLLLTWPYATSRTQNLIWSHTQCDALRFESRLSFGKLLGITLKNWALMLLTLGLYWPFAAVAIYRARVEAITPQLLGDLEHLRNDFALQAGDASGDAAGDMFGIDIGF